MSDSERVSGPPPARMPDLRAPCAPLKPVPGPTPLEFVTIGWPPFFETWPPRWWTRLREGLKA